MMFRCSQCGECCRNINKAPIYKELDSGNGVCRYLKGNLCSIYEKRPLFCRVDESYDTFFKYVMKLEDYYKLNYEACKRLKKSN